MRIRLGNGRVIVATEEFAEAHFPGDWTVEPDLELPPTVLTTVTKLAFKNRFPRAKWIAAKQASVVNAGLADFFESFELARYIDLELPETIQAVSALSAPEIPVEFKLTPSEVSAVLDTPVAPHESP